MAALERTGDSGARDCLMESDLRYYTRRLGAERLAAARAVTAEARERRLRLVAAYERKIQALMA